MGIWRKLQGTSKGEKPHPLAVSFVDNQRGFLENLEYLRARFPRVYKRRRI